MSDQPGIQQIQEELIMLLKDPLFLHSRQASDFLAFIIRETLAGRREMLKEYTIGVEIFQKGDDFQPQTDPSVRIAAGRLRNRLQQYYEQRTGKGVEISIPKGGYIPLFRLRDFSAAHKGDEPNDDQPTSLAVAPFEYASSKETALFADLLSQELKRALGSNEDFILRGDGTADYLLTGKIFKRRGRLILYSDLIDSVTGSIVWTESFPLKSPGRFPVSMAEALAARVASIVADRGVLYDLLGNEILGSSVIPSDPRGVRILYVQHKKQMDPGVAGRLKASLERLSIQQDHRGDLKALFSQLYWDFCMDLDWNSIFNHDESYRFFRDMAVKLWQEAQQLDPEGEDTLVSGIRCAFHLEDYDALRSLSERLFRSHNVSVFSMTTGALLYALGGGWDVGKAILEDTLELIPNYPGWFHHLDCQYSLRQMDYERVLELAKSFGKGDILWYYLYSAAALSLLGLLEEGRAYWEALVTQCPDSKRCMPNFLSNYVKDRELKELILSALVPLGWKPA